MIYQVKDRQMVGVMEFYEVVLSVHKGDEVYNMEITEVISKDIDGFSVRDYGVRSIDPEIRDLEFEIINKLKKEGLCLSM